jgi:hypothetical protein
MGQNPEELNLCGFFKRRENIFISTNGVLYIESALTRRFKAQGQFPLDERDGTLKFSLKRGNFL